MDPTALLKIVTSVCLSVLTLCLVPALISITRAATRLDSLLLNLNRELPDLLKSLATTTRELEILSLTVNSKLEQTDRILETTQLAGDTLLTTSRMIRDVLVPVAAQVGGLHSGIKAFIHFFTSDRNK